MLDNILSCCEFLAMFQFLDIFFKLMHLNFKGLTWKSKGRKHMLFFFKLRTSFIWVGSEHIALLLCPCEQSDSENSSPYSYILNGKKILASADTQKSPSRPCFCQCIAKQCEISYLYGRKNHKQVFVKTLSRI